MAEDVNKPLLSEGWLWFYVLKYKVLIFASLLVSTYFSMEWLLF